MQVVRKHNDLRRQVAQGKERRSLNNWGAQPKAANMRELSWDDELAVMAQMYNMDLTFTFIH